MFEHPALRRALCISVVLLFGALLPFSTRAAAAQPTVEITSVPPYGGSLGVMRGIVRGVDASTHRVAVYIHVEGLGWWTKESFAKPTVPINSDGSFTANVTTGGLDHLATIFCASVVPAGHIPPRAAGSRRCPPDPQAVAMAFRERYGRLLTFAGRTWAVKDATMPVGPGRNVFSSHSSDVWVDSEGLHLTIHFRDGQWWSSEVILLNHLGYGTYVFKTRSPVATLDVNATLGMFTWDAYGDDESSGESHHRELDIEDSRWGVPSDPNTQVVVQPWDVSGNRHRFNLPVSSPGGLTRAFTWQPESVRFLTLSGDQSPDSFPPVSLIDDWTYTHDPNVGHYVPARGRERVRLNLWLNRLAPPSDGQPIEIVISSFSFLPSTPDLVVTSVSNPPLLAQLGTKFPVTDTTKNVGTSVAGPSTTHYYLSLDQKKNSGDKLLSGSRAVPPLAPGEESEGSVTVTVPASTRLPGPYWLLACTDDLRAVAEGNAGGPAESNNCRSSATQVTITAPDLVVRSLAEPPPLALLNAAIPLNVCVMNVATATAPAGVSSTRLYLSTDGVAKTKLLTGAITVPAAPAATLPPGVESCGSRTVTIPSTTRLGLYFLLACADSTKTIAEGNLLNDGSAEGNNCRKSAGRIDVKAPDLRVAAVSKPPAAARFGGVFAVTDTTVNDVTATGAAGPSTTRYYLSLDQIRNTGDVRLAGSRGVLSLLPGQSSTGTVNVTVPATGIASGTYFLLGCADDLKRVAESSLSLTVNAEANNCTSSASGVVVNP